jgi:hypothetical protein
LEDIVMVVVKGWKKGLKEMRTKGRFPLADSHGT